jgi:signal transduction histidine kinase
MRDNVIERILLEISQSLNEVSAHLSPHVAKIHSSWRKLLKRYQPCGRHAAVLTVEQLTSQIRGWSSANLRDFREKSERQGKDLARNGVPAKCAAVVVALYIKSCLPYLLSNDSKRVEWTRAFTRWASVYLFFLLSGYAKYEQIERLELEERINLAERRSQDFTAKLGDAYEKEKHSLAQDLHDHIGHDLIVLKLYTEMISLDFKKGDVSRLRGKLKESISLIKHALASVRHLTFNLGPAIWNEQGFVPAVRLYAHQLSRRTGIRVRVNALRLRAKLPARVETALYNALQGALSNVVAHAEAGHVRITLASGRDFITMKVQDDGKGFNVAGKLRAPRQSFGLRAMQDRMGLLGGTVHFSSHSGRQRRGALKGTLLEFHLPLSVSKIA